MTAFTTERLTVTPWGETLEIPTARTTLEGRLAQMLTPEVLEHLPPDFAPGTGPDAMSDWIATRRARAEVCLVETQNALIGLLFLFRPETQGPRHLGYLLDKAVWGKGYASEMVRGLVAHLSQTGPFELLAGVAEENPASARLLLKSGFTESAPDPETGTRQFRLLRP